MRRFSVAGGPSEIVFNGNLLVVACSKANRLQVIDLDQNKTVAAISVEGNGPFAICCSEVDNPFVYCFCDSSSLSSEIMQFDLQKMSLVSKQNPGRAKILVSSATMSSDGKWLILSHEGTAPSVLLKVDEAAGKYRFAEALRRPRGVIQRDSDSRFWIAKGLLYPISSVQPLQIFSGDSANSIHAPSNLVASMGKDFLYIESLTDSTRPAKIKVEKLTENEIASYDPMNLHQRGIPRVDLQFLSSSRKVLIGNSHRGHLIPYELTAANNLKTSQGTASQPDREGIKYVDTSETVKSWAVEPETGRVFAAIEEADAVVEFDAQGNELRRIRTFGGPTELLIKNDLLAL